MPCIAASNPGDEVLIRRVEVVVRRVKATEMVVLLSRSRVVPIRDAGKERRSQ